jgi:hypothetical protein
MDTNQFEEALCGLGLAAALALSGHAASEALNVPGEPRVVGNVILNCFRMAIDVKPSIDDAILATEEWAEISVEDECHFINIHEIDQKWRIDAAYHYVIGSDESGEFTAGISGLLIMNTSVIPDDQADEVHATLQKLGKILLDAHQAGDEGDLDPRWRNVQSTMHH